MKMITKRLLAHTLILTMFLSVVPSFDIHAAETIAVDEDHFPDENFRTYILQNIDENKDKSLTEEECQKVTSIDVKNSGIRNLSGIKYFTSLKYLYCNKNQLTELDVSYNTVLRYLNCADNQLSGLDLSMNAVLQTVYCDNNSISSLDLSHNPELDRLMCSNNGLTELDLTSNPEMNTFDCSKNSLTKLDLSIHSRMDYLKCNDNNLTELRVDNCSKLRTLYCYRNKLTELTLNGKSELTTLNCEQNNLTDLELKGVTKLPFIQCDYNPLSSLDVSQCASLEVLYCRNCSLTSLDLSSNSKLRDLDCRNNQITQLNLNGCSNLKQICCYSNFLNSLDLSSTDKIEYLTCYSNNISNLNLSCFESLQSVLCNNNPLTELDVRQNPQLVKIDCSDTGITSIDLSQNPELGYIKCTGTGITLLDLRNNSKSTKPGCDSGTKVVWSDEDLGWSTVNGNTYYVVDDGTTPKTSHLATGLMEISGRKFYFDDHGVLQTDILIPSQITTVPSSITMTVWDTVTVQVDSEPEGITGDDLVWISENESVVTVNEDGTIFPVSTGTTSVTVSSVYDKSVMYVIPVTVRPLISLEAEELAIMSGDTREDKVTQNSNMIDSISWESKDPSIAKVTSDYKILGESEGETDIILIVSDGNGRTESFTIHVTVSSSDSINTNVCKIELYYDGKLITEENDISCLVNDTLNITAKVFVDGEEEGYYYSFDQSLIQTSDGRIQLIWKSTNMDVASVDKGNVIVNSAGTAFITAQAMGTSTMSDVVTVSAKERPIRLRSLSIGGTDSIILGQNTYLKPSFVPMNAANKKATWKSDDTTIATVNSYGMVTGVSLGTTTIHLISDENKEIMDTINIEVKPIQVTSIIVDSGIISTSTSGNSFDSSNEISEGDVLSMKHGIDQKLYLRTTVNEDAEDKALAVRVFYDNTPIIAAQDVTSVFSGLTDENQIFSITFADLGDYSVEFYALDHGGAARAFTVKVLPYDEWIIDESGKKSHYSKDKKDIGWSTISGKKYYFDASGILLTGWKKISGNWYFLGTDGVLQIGWKQIGGKWYFLGTNGILQTGWKKLSNKWYYFGTDGILRTGWQKVGKSWYYFGTDGVMRTGWQKVGKSWYYFGTNGVMRTGWQKIGKSWYFLKNGVMFTGWIKSGGKWYYFNSNGVMVTGSVKIGTKTYQFNSSGVCLNP